MDEAPAVPGEGGEHDEDTLGAYEGPRNIDNQRHGKGFALLPNGDMYDGQYRFGKRHGKGLYVFRNGAQYSGDYRIGMKHGFGKFIYPDGTSYEGEWDRDRKHGQGIYRYSNGDYYEGTWYKGERDGLGAYFHSKDGVKFVGMWVHGKREGTAQVHYPAFRHHGDWRDNMPIGKGCFTFDTNAMQLGRYIHIKDPEILADEEEESATVGVVEGEEMEIPPERGYPKGIVPVWRPEEYIKFSADKLPPEPVAPPRTPSDIVEKEEGIDDEPSLLDLLPGDDDDDDYSEYDIEEFLYYFLEDEARKLVEFVRDYDNEADFDDEPLLFEPKKTLSDEMREKVCGPGTDLPVVEEEEELE